MNFTYFTAQRIGPSSKGKNKMSNTALNIAGSAVSIGIAVMLIAVAIVIGYKNEIYKKLMGFESHISITNRDMNMTYETIPIDKNIEKYIDFEAYEQVIHHQIFATKPAIISQNEEIQGVILKGIGNDYDTDFIQEHLTQGKLLNITPGEKSNETVISKQLAIKLGIDLGDKIKFFFIQDPPRVRALKVAGIYNTGMQTIDELFVLCDIKHIQKLNGWSPNEVGGIEIKISKLSETENTTNKIRNKLSGVITEEESMFKINNFKENNPMLIRWLSLTDKNAEIILILMIIVAVFNMISGLLIIILERTNMIGILKAMGASNFQIKKIFIFNGAQLILRAMIWGNLIGIGLLALQKYAELIPLDPAIYYVDTVPVSLNLTHILMLNLGTALITILALFLPTLVISKISPSKTIKFN
ncbi:MAG: FtsX-like permease family protein [Bacteroidota bacterium]|nr:FtsX-like permease family protein [Bacteroidota bacterium]